ncbi:MAG: hypothetical protein LCH74_13505 [Proteobacteria bacterium]|nr:hypothetical protein [Pseudomonadota bacterium]
MHQISACAMTDRVLVHGGSRRFFTVRHSRFANCISLPITKLRKLFTTFPVADRHHHPPTGRHEISVANVGVRFNHAKSMQRTELAHEQL